ncbi:MAG: PepSY-like domain-containing protein [Bacteroidetes bacterium]|nr:PepSY-like domain-containing protein [Bacteroidota bacterium]
MNFKKYFFLPAIFVFMSVMSCQKLSLSPQDDSNKISIDDVPVQTVDYIDQTFGGESIIKIEKKFNKDGSFKSYEVYLSNGVELYFDINWNQIFDDSGNGNDDNGSSSSSSNNDDSFDIDFDDLPQVVKDYMSQNYPGANIKKVKKKINDNGSPRLYEIRLADNTKIFFNGAGQFIGIDD